MSYSIIAENEQYTVVSEYSSSNGKVEKYQTEAQLEAELISMLQQQGYDYLPIKTEEDLIANLRVQLQNLNHYTFSDNEWKNFFNTVLANKNDGIVEKTTKIQEDYIQVLRQDNGQSRNIRLLDKKDIHNNSLQVINQYNQEEGNHPTRYDVTILVNGLPLVHMELKRRGVQLKEAFNQINRYQRDSFWSGAGLFEYVQIFIISNGTNTKYYSNTTRQGHIKEQQRKAVKGKKASNSFEFTSFWADGNNRVITDIIDFTKTFLCKRTILNVLVKYCVLTSEKMLLVMRPYQIAATERIINKIIISQNYKKYGSIEGGGYIWHTTGSGKTLTSFKTAQLASRIEGIEKVIFVVDRNDLDYQTMREYDRFEKGCANGNTSTAVLQRQLENRNDKGNPHQYKVIVTTIQKLSIFIQRNPTHDIYNRQVVFIFDECHRSHFGTMHQQVVKHFKKYYLFGFTGTPIFAVNAVSGGLPTLRTTQQAFGDKLHTYTIVDAIQDENVLPFRIDYINTIKAKANIQDQQVQAINTEAALQSPEHVQSVVKYILQHFDHKTKRSEHYTFNALDNIQQIAVANQPIKEKKAQKILLGFNAMFAVASVPMAKMYYQEFKRQQALLPEAQRLKVALIYSYSSNEEEVEKSGFLLEENTESTTSLDQQSRDFLDGAIGDYNAYFGCNYDTSAEKFQNYYKDLSMRMKNREVDLLIVVNMFLTGFDATTLNTLFVDKNLRHHGLIQAFSRTNRILNSVKKFGNIVCFRNLQQEVDDAIALFGDKQAGGIVLLKSFDQYYNGYDDPDGKHHPGYKELVEKLKSLYPLDQVIEGEKAQKDFVHLFGALLRTKNILDSFDQFESAEKLPLGQMQDYQSRYLDIRDSIRPVHKEKEIINDDLVFELELIRQIEVNIDYILMLVQKYHQSNCQDSEVLLSISKAIGSSDALRSKKALIEEFVASLSAESDIETDWPTYVKQQQEAELQTIIKEENLDKEKTIIFTQNAFRDGAVKTIGTDIDQILPSMSRFTNPTLRQEKKERVIDRLKAFFEKFNLL